MNRRKPIVPYTNPKLEAIKKALKSAFDYAIMELLLPSVGFLYLASILVFPALLCAITLCLGLLYTESLKEDVVWN
jgi:hypothetical protein